MDVLQKQRRIKAIFLNNILRYLEDNWYSEPRIVLSENAKILYRKAADELFVLQKNRTNELGGH